MSLEGISPTSLIKTSGSDTVNQSDTPPNLKKSQSVTPGTGTGGTVPDSGMQTPPSSGVPKGAHALTLDVTGKRDAILDGLPPDLNQALHDKISGGDVSAKDLKELLHFGFFSTKGTTAETRVEIRTVLAQAIASGMSLDDAAALKVALKKASPGDIAALRSEITASGSLMGGIADSIYKSSVGRAPQTNPVSLTSLCKELLSLLPPDPSKANERILQGDAVTISHNSKGQPHIEYVVARCIGTVPLNVDVSAQDVQNIRDLFEEVCSVKYSRANAHLQLMQEFRDARAENRNVTLAEVLGEFQPDGNGAVRDNGRGDCISLTARIMSRLKDMGFNAQVVGQYNPNLTEQSVNRQFVDVADTGLRSGGVTHLDVIIPYRNENGEDRVILIQPGLGTDDEHFQDLSAAQFLKSFGRGKLMDGDGGSIDIRKVQIEAMGYLTNLQIKNTDENTPNTERQMFGVDLIGGSVYLNGNSSKLYDGVRMKEGGSVSFNYRDVMADPDTQVDVKLPDGKGGFDTVHMSNLEALTLFLEAVKADYDQPDGFVENMLTLFQHEGDFKAAALWQSVKDIHKI